jgi:hypothetical protein
MSEFCHDALPADAAFDSYRTEAMFQSVFAARRWLTSGSQRYATAQCERKYLYTSIFLIAFTIMMIRLMADS